MNLRKLPPLVLTASLVALPLGASVRVIDESAIPYSGFLRKAEFDQRFPGETYSNSQSIDLGWYVLYSQASLQYLFGPISLQSTGQDYLDQLKGIVEEAVEQRPEISDYSLRLIKTPFDLENLPKTVENNDEEFSQDAGTPPPPSPPSMGFWGMIKRWFGF